MICFDCYFFCKANYIQRFVIVTHQIYNSDLSNSKLANFDAGDDMLMWHKKRKIMNNEWTPDQGLAKFMWLWTKFQLQLECSIFYLKMLSGWCAQEVNSVASCMILQEGCDYQIWNAGKTWPFPELKNRKKRSNAILTKLISTFWVAQDNRCQLHSGVLISSHCQIK